jgi:hypothetical protein
MGFGLVVSGKGRLKQVPNDTYSGIVDKSRLFRDGFNKIQ